MHGLLRRLPGLTALCLTLCLSACAVTQAPLVTDGPSAVVRDTWEAGGSSALFFVLEKVGDVRVLRTSLSVARAQGLASGHSFGPLHAVGRAVPAGIVTLTLRGRHAWTAPGDLLFGMGRPTDVRVVITVKLQPGEEYRVRGVLGDSHPVGNGLWIESARTGQRLELLKPGLQADVPGPAAVTEPHATWSPPEPVTWRRLSASS